MYLADPATDADLGTAENKIDDFIKSDVRRRFNLSSFLDVYMNYSSKYEYVQFY